MQLSSRNISRGHSLAYTLAEILVSVFVLAVMLTSLYAGFSSGFAIVKLSQENLRATQIMVQKLEGVRIFTWSQVTNSTFLKTNFTDYYNPSGTNNNTYGAVYQGFVSRATPGSVPPAYANNMVAINVTLFWTNYLQKPNTNVIVRSRQMQTYVARYGMQDYIYKWIAPHHFPLPRTNSLQAFTLVEMLIAAATATIVLGLAMTLYLFGLRSFGAIGNYASMDSKSRQALDFTLREIRQAARVVGFQTNGSTRWLTVAYTNSPPSTSTFTWDSSTGLFTWDKTGQATRTLLTGCTSWSFACYLRAPDTNGTFVPTASKNRTKLVNMAWTCNRTNVFRINTESIVTAEVVLRNLQE